MKPTVWLGLLLCFATAVAQTTPADKDSTRTPAPPAKTGKSSGVRIVLPDDKAKPATKAAPTAGAKAADSAAKAKKEEPPPKIEGMEISRGPEKGYLGVEIKNACFVIHFYDAKKKAVAPDVTSALLRWDPKNKIGSERLVLMPAETSLTSPRNIQPPYNFKLFISFLKPPAEGADPVVSETYTVDFRQ